MNYVQWGDRLLNETQLEIIEKCLRNGSDVELQYRRDGIYIIECRKRVHIAAGKIRDGKLNNSSSDE